MKNHKTLIFLISLAVAERAFRLNAGALNAGPPERPPGPPEQPPGPPERPPGPPERPYKDLIRSL